MAESELVARANTGDGTDKLLTFENGAGKHAGAVVVVDASGSPYDGISPFPVNIQALNAGAISTPSANIAGLPVRQLGQESWICSFSASGASVLASDLTLIRAGAGVTYSQGSGALAVVAGTTANSEFLARSNVAWQSSMMVRASTVLSQRIANNNFAVVLADIFGEGLSCTINSATSITVTKVGHGLTGQNVGQFMFIGGISGANGVPGRYAIASIPTADTVTFTVAGWPASGSCTVTAFGHNHVKLLYNGTTATAVAFDAQRNGWATGDTTATINTTASPGHVAQLHIDGRDIYFSDTLRASTTTPTVTTRASRYEGIPDDGTNLYLFLWLYNGTTNPASSTTWTVSFLSVERFSNVPVYVQGNRQQGAAAPMPVSMQGTGTVTISGAPTLGAGTALAADFGMQYRANATGAASIQQVVAAASTNPTVVKASAGRLLGFVLTNNATAVRYVKFHNQTTSPTAGTGVVQSYGIPPNGGTVAISIPGGVAFSTGIALTTVTGAATTDATAVAVNDIVGTIHYA